MKSHIEPLVIDGLRAYSSGEREALTNHETWEVYLIDEDGFSAADDERAVEILSLFPDDELVRHEFGDAIPESITVCRRDAKPQPQSEGSEFLRQPGSRMVEDFLDFSLLDAEDAEDALRMWQAAHGAAYALNLGEMKMAARP